jgi:hypothetical protein
MSGSFDIFFMRILRINGKNAFITSWTVNESLQEHRPKTINKPEMGYDVGRVPVNYSRKINETQREDDV